MARTAPVAKPAAPAARTFTQAEVNAEAARIAEQTTFNRSVDAAVIAGRAAHPDYDEAIAGLKSMTGPIVPQELIVAALADRRGQRGHLPSGEEQRCCRSHPIAPADSAGCRSRATCE